MPILSKYPQYGEDLLMKNSPIPISAKCPYSVSMTAMLNYMWIEIDHASFSLNCLCNVMLCFITKILVIYSVSQLLCPCEYTVFQSNEAVSKFLRDCMAGCSGQEGSKETSTFFSCVVDPPEINITVLFGTLCCCSSKEK